MTRLAPYIRRALGGATPRGVVLLYHRVTDLETDPQRLAVSPSHFRSHLAAIVRLGVPMSLRAMIDAAQHRSLPDGAVAVTFDDGYADNLMHAVPLLVEAGVPATVFLSTGSIVNGREFWWDELERVMAAGAIDHSAYDRLILHLRRATADERQEEIDTLVSKARIPRAPRSAHRPLAPEEVSALASAPGITIGSHTVNHPSLAALPADIQYGEIASARGTLEERIGRSVDLFAYPFGGADDVSADTIAAARRAGMTIACTTSGGAITTTTDPMQVPRVGVSDWSGAEFACRFAWWTGAPR